MILCCGEALIDLIPQDDGSEAALVGGSVLNTAVALGRLGARAGMLTGLSSDTHGQAIEAHLNESHVDTSTCIRSDRPTTLAIVTFHDGQPSYRFEDEGSAARMITPEDVPELPADIQAMVFGGISLIQPPFADTMAHLCAHAPEGALRFIDLNVRPGFIDDPAAYRARIDGMLQTADIVKVSDEDLDWLYPDTSDQIAALMEGTSLTSVLRTLGSEGAELHMNGRTLHVPAQRVTVADTVGAGDTFNAGFLAHLAAKNTLSVTALTTASDALLTDALSHAVAAAAVTVSRAGANPPWAHELKDAS